MYEDSVMRRGALRLGALDYISKISFDGDECDQILELVERSIRKISRKKNPGRRIPDSRKGWKKRGRIPDGSLMTVSSTDCAR